MNIPKNYNSISKVFFFPHQDDEFAVFSIIDNAIKGNENILCVFTTTGLKNNPINNKRNDESLRVLTFLGVNAHSILFIGSKHNILVNEFMYNMNLFESIFLKIIENTTTETQFYIPAWEGGQPDHDALHACILICHKRFNLKNTIYQFPLYNNYKCALKFFKVLYPLPKNGCVIQAKIPLILRFKYLFLCLNYPSQTATWIGLFPFVFFKKIFNGLQQLQPVDYSRIFKRPHNGKLYYEVRNWTTWEKLSSIVKEFSR